MKLLLTFLISSIGFLACGTTVRSGQAGLFWTPRGEGLGKQVLPPGFHSHGIMTDIILYDSQWKSYEEKIDVITLDDLHIDVISSVVLRPKLSELYSLEKEIGTDYYRKIVRPEFRTSVRNVLTQYPMIQISKKTPEIELQIKKAIRERIESKYLEVDDVFVGDITFSASILEAIEKKIQKEQELETMKFELSIAQKDNDIARMKAKREAEMEIIKAEAQAKAQELINSKLTTKYLQFKALESPNAKIIYYPIGKDNLPTFLNIDEKEKAGK